MLVFRHTGERKSVNSKSHQRGPADANPQLIATQDFANLAGAPTPDFIMPPLLNPIGGKGCFTNNPLNTNALPPTDSVSYRNFPSAQTPSDSPPPNPPAPPAPPPHPPPP